jgi:uncharacterized protein (DUF433 family)
MSLPLRAEPIPIQLDRDGVAHIANTRVTLDTVVIAFRQGATAEEIAQQYPTLSLADVYAVITYYLREQPDVDAYIAARQEAAASVRRLNEARFDPAGIRERLLSRRANKA